MTPEQLDEFGQWADATVDDLDDEYESEQYQAGYSDAVYVLVNRLRANYTTG